MTQLIQKMINSKFCISMSEARRYVAQGAVKVNGEVVRDPQYELKEKDQLQVGRKKNV